MAQAIVGGAIAQGVLEPASIIASSPSEASRAVFADWGCYTVANNTAVVDQADQVMLAVKPQVFPAVAPQLLGGSAEQVLISIMAGLSSEKIVSLIGATRRVVRVMPNTPSLVGQGVAGIALGAGARASDDALAKLLFASVGQVVELDESQIDAISTISGSGPAYLFYLAEAMEQAARDLGLGEHARQVVGQTLMGAGQLLAESGEAPEALRRKVTSPGGTTLAATTHLDEKGVQLSIVEAIQAACRRAKELGA